MRHPADYAGDILEVVNADGTIGASFTGHVRAQGLDLDFVPGAGAGANNEVRWVRPADGLAGGLILVDSDLGGAPHKGPSVGAIRIQDPDNAGVAYCGVDFYADDLNVGNLSYIELVARGVIKNLLRSDGSSDFMQLGNNAPAQVRYHGRILLANFPPANPVDGDLVDVVIDAAAGVVWRFLYRAGSASAFKWEYVGGAPAIATVATQENTASAVYADLATVGPSVTLPRAGDYLVRFGCRMFGAAAAFRCNAAIKRGAAAAVDADSITFGGPGSVTFDVSTSREIPVAGMAAADVVKIQYRQDGGAALFFEKRWLSVTPVRIS